MICLRGPADVLPELGTLLSPELIIVGRAHDPRTSLQRLVTWYVTPAHPSPTRYLEAPDNAAAEVEPDVVRSGVEALVRLIPPLNHHDQRIEASVFAGYKQDFDGEPTRRTCELVDDERNVLMVLPSVLANAVPNALDALRTLRQRLEAPPHDPLVPSSGTVGIGELNEEANQTRWSGWGEFVDAYGVPIS